MGKCPQDAFAGKISFQPHTWRLMTLADLLSNQVQQGPPPVERTGDFPNGLPRQNVIPEFVAFCGRSGARDQDLAHDSRQRKDRCRGPSNGNIDNPDFWVMSLDN